MLNPTHTLVYLGFKIDAMASTIQLTLAAHDRMVYLLGYTRRGSARDRERIAGYCNWILYNLRFPHFLSADIQRGDPSWLLGALRDLSVLQPRSLIDGVMVVNLYTDAIPHSLAAIIPAQNLAHTQAFLRPEDINRAEAITAL